jgi:hypothetical protein
MGWSRPSRALQTAPCGGFAAPSLIPNGNGDLQTRRSAVVAHSHSIVPGGLLVTSRVTRLISRTSLVIRVEMRASTS